jgi:hypothetical protein
MVARNLINKPTVTIFDKMGKIQKKNMLGTRSSFLYLMLLTIILLTLPPMHHGYSLITNSLSILSSSSFKDDLAYYHIVGEVTNQGNEKATFVKVSDAFYNSGNTVVASDFTFTDPQDLEPGQTTPFDITVSAPMANEITSASVDVDSVQYSSVIQNETK